MLGGLGAAVATVDGPVVLVGNSLGGWLVLRYALDHPEKVDRVVLVNSAGLKWTVDKGVLLPTTREGQRAKNVAVMGECAASMPGSAAYPTLTTIGTPSSHLPIRSSRRV